MAKSLQIRDKCLVHAKCLTKALNNATVILFGNITVNADAVQRRKADGRKRKNY